MAVGDKFFAVMKNELAVSNGVATLGPDGLLNASQRPITDSMPTQGSSNPVQSGGVFSALSNKADKGPPQEYDLPLAEGVSGAIKYSKDQMGVVRLLGQVELATNQSGIIGIGTLPEGFYLEYAVATVCCGWPDGGANIAPCTAVVNADGVVAINAFDASLKVFAVNVSFGG